MGLRALLTKQQGQYRYDPTALDQAGPARLFPYAGGDGVLRYVLKRLRLNLVNHAQLSSPWVLLLQEVDQTVRSLDDTWIKAGTLLVDWEIFQSNWFNFNLPPDQQFDVAFVQKRRDLGRCCWRPAKRPNWRPKPTIVPWVNATKPSDRSSTKRWKPKAAAARW